MYVFVCVCAGVCMCVCVCVCVCVCAIPLHRDVYLFICHTLVQLRAVLGDLPKARCVVFYIKFSISSELITHIDSCGLILFTLH